MEAVDPDFGVGISDLMQREEMLGHARLEMLPGSTFAENSTVVVTPSRDEKVHWKVARSWLNLCPPMNGFRPWLWAVGDEVGKAYTRTIQNILNDPVLSKCKYLLTLEDDNVIPPDAHILLLDTINSLPELDVVSGIYFTKGALNMPMAYGDPRSLEKTGKVDFKPRDIKKAARADSPGNIMEVNGVGMGCCLWKMDLFREIEPPWYVTVSGFVPEKGLACITQDLFFCERLRLKGKRLAVDLRVRVGHIDRKTGVMY